MTKFERFKQGLENYDLTYDKIINSGWNYCGGNFNQHLNYYYLRFGEGEPLLPHERECVCGKKGLVNNGYICNKKETDFLVLGSCCIKQFVGGRTCEKCGESHKRHKSNICKWCEKYRVWCDRKQKYRYRKTMICEGVCNSKIPNHEWKKKCIECHKLEKIFRPYNKIDL